MLGLIWPDDGLARPDYELLGGPEAAEALGVSGLRLAVAFSKAEPRHHPADLRVTGDSARLDPAARELKRAGCDAIIWACTSGSFIGGLSWAGDQARALNATSGLAASSTTLAYIEALDFLGAVELDLLGPYPEDITRAFRRCLGEAGFTVRACSALGTADAPASFRLDAVSEVAAFAKGRPSARPLLLPDTAINSLENVEAMERAAGRPVLTANQVTLWMGLRLMGVNPRGLGPGRLFE
jgi:maleate isomerase